MKGLHCSVYRTDGIDCSIEGISKKHNHLILVSEGIPEIFAATPDCPAVELVKKNVYGKEYLCAKPLDHNDKWYMMGGNFLYTCDSRFPQKYPIPIHDRFEP